MKPLFRAYLITCAVTAKRYVGISVRGDLRQRWREHVYNSQKRPNASALYAAIAKYGKDNFSIEAVCSAKSKEDMCVVETVLIHQFGTLAPSGYNLTLGSEGRFGYAPSAESIERSAAGHRGKPCHPNTRKSSSEYHKGTKKSAETREKMAAARRGIPMGAEAKSKISEYWESRRNNGDFKTDKQYAHGRVRP